MEPLLVRPLTPPDCLPIVYPVLPPPRPAAVRDEDDDDNDDDDEDEKEVEEVEEDDKGDGGSLGVDGDDAPATGWLT